ncbi:glycine betaine/proline transport system ATP-binding protein [Haloactinopolyspora alba]|uniref:Glycine betaine/proline transport system ATP-binding protein n=1 Tax=Haloactinopolyspora alba TaxID=648780 RepID=A0A2P8D5A4_9ACTN|nr:glycine betaine/proline transport system ATP-binding protein [Haloactinopolyspora alba]
MVMGLSGSGKSTLIRMLNGLWETTAGDVYIDDVDIAKIGDAELREVRQQKISMVFQHFALLPHRTVAQNAAYALNIQGMEKEERLKKAEEALEMVGLKGWGDKFPAQLSGGMKQRVGLARALAAGSDIMLMDEAFSALDPLIRREMQDQLIELQSRLNKTIVFITHDLNEAMRLGDRIAVMRDGRIVQIGTAEEVLNDPANDYVAQFVADVDRTRVLTASSVMETAQFVVNAEAGPREAQHTMREKQMAAAFAVGRRDNRLQGVVHDKDVVAAVNRGDQKIEGIIDTDVSSVHQDTYLADLFAPSAESPLPLAVVDDDHRLVGVVPRVTLLAAMASISETLHEAEAATAGTETEAVTTEQGGAAS